jgi:hypothetical protein
LVAGVAAMAMAVPASAKPEGRGGDKGGGKPAKVERGGGGGKQVRAERRGGGEVRQRGRERREARVERRGPERREAKVERRGPERKVRAERVRGSERREAKVEQVRGRDRDRPFREARADRNRDRDRGLVRIERRDDDRRDGFSLRYANNDRSRGLIDGCPPGLAAKNNGCLPPGQAKQLMGHALPAAFAGSLLPAAYHTYYPDTDDYYYRQGDGLLYRIARSTGLVDGYSPMWGYGADYTPDYYFAGEQYPLDYVSFYNVPAPYQRYYQDEDDWLYRYGDGGIYRVNRSNGLVDSIVALLAGDLAVGQPLPAGYDVYNVPYAYRDEYYDTPDRWYRYNDGNIYQVDPTTRLVQAVIQALV